MAWLFHDGVVERKNRELRRSRELLGHTLSVIVLKSELAAKKGPRAENVSPA